jgi:hypothetical protein
MTDIVEVLRSFSGEAIAALGETDGALYVHWFELDHAAHLKAQELDDTVARAAKVEELIAETEALITKHWPPITAHENWLRTVRPERFAN